jgi:hypothetical protein
MLWHSWLRRYTASLKAPGSVPDEGTDLLHLHNTSSRTTALGFTQPLAELSTRMASTVEQVEQED